MFRKVFRQVDGPTWIVALVIYAGWGALIWYNAALPWWFMMPVALGLLWVELKALSYLFIDRPVPPPVSVASQSDPPDERPMVR